MQYQDSRPGRPGPAFRKIKAIARSDQQVGSFKFSGMFPTNYCSHHSKAEVIINAAPGRRGLPPCRYELASMAVNKFDALTP